MSNPPVLPKLHLNPAPLSSLLHVDPLVVWPDRPLIRQPPGAAINRAALWNTDDFRPMMDVLLNSFYEVGVVVVCSSGNNATWDLRDYLPQGAGGANTPLIVVGNAMLPNGRPYPTSTWLDAGNRGILTLYNAGTNVSCALYDGGLLVANGSSQATAITSGQVAYYLGVPAIRAAMGIDGGDHAQTAARVKQYLIQQATEFKGDLSWGDGIPRAALGDVLPCADDVDGVVKNKPRFVPNPNPRAPADIQVLTHGAVPLEPIVSSFPPLLRVPAFPRAFLRLRGVAPTHVCKCGILSLFSLRASNCPTFWCRPSLSNRHRSPP